MTARLIVINGGSSSGKSGIVRCLQEILPDPWLAFGVDNFIEAIPARMQSSAAGIEFGPEGQVVVGPVFRQLGDAWVEGIAAMCRAGADVILDEVFLGGRATQLRLQAAIGDIEVAWIGVHCDATVAADREVARGDRVSGMAASQAELVHEGVIYDLEVDSTHTEALDCARTIALHLA